MNTFVVLKDKNEEKDKNNEDMVVLGSYGW